MIRLYRESDGAEKEVLKESTIKNKYLLPSLKAKGFRELKNEESPKRKKRNSKPKPKVVPPTEVKIEKQKVKESK